FASRRRHTRLVSDWSSDVCSSDLIEAYVSGEGGSSPLPTGTVTFKDGTTTLGTGTLDGSSNAVIFTVTGGLSVGSHSLSAAYGEIGRASCRGGVGGAVGAGRGKKE